MVFKKITLESIKEYQQAGKIAAQVLEYGRNLIKPGAEVKEILALIEKKIKSLGGEIAFPAQLSLNEFAAHSCATLEESIFLEDQIVKLDIGVHQKGYIADTALTVDLSHQYSDLIKATREALNQTLKIIAPGLTLGEIGKTIQEVITSYGFAPVRNLCGHGLDRYQVHTKPTIPNFNNHDQTPLEENIVFAVEPFASTGAGLVQESSPATVFSLIREQPVRDPFTQKILEEIKTYQGLPFAKRWLEKKFSPFQTNFALKILKSKGCLKEHPPLFDQRRGLVSQAEHSIILKEKPLVFTKND